MSVKALRHYHRIGLLVPADVDRHTGRRRYEPEQIRRAQVIRRLRDLQMPLEEIAAVLDAPTIEARNERISAHLGELERSLAQTVAAVSTLRELLDGGGNPHGPIRHRSVPDTASASITDTVELAGASVWFQGAIGELFATVAAQGLVPAGPPGGVYAAELFTEHKGTATVFVPVDGEPAPAGRVQSETIAAAELAVIVHRGSHAGIDRSYGALAEHVARSAVAVEGPIREYYLVGRHTPADERDWQTEIGWPIFRTAAAAPR